MSEIKTPIITAIEYLASRDLSSLFGIYEDVLSRRELPPHNLPDETNEDDLIRLILGLHSEENPVLVTTLIEDDFAPSPFIVTWRIDQEDPINFEKFVPQHPPETIT